MAPKRSFWSLSTTEARAHLMILAAVVWTMAVVQSFRAPILFGDFVCPYTMAGLARDPGTLYDVNAFHRTQVALVPASAPLLYPPVYPPQTSLIFAPFRVLPFSGAATLWALVTIAVYASIARDAFRTAEPTRLDARLVATAAFAFAPFVELVRYGQSTIILVAACYAAYRALNRQRPVLAGAALGLLALKPQFGLPFAVVVLAGGEWAMLAGAILSVTAQAAAVWIVMGREAFTRYAALLPDIVRNTDALEANKWTVHSLRSLTQLLPSPAATLLWAGMSAVVLWYVARVWRSDALLSVRFGFAMLAAVLVSPHLLVYDATLAALPLLWFGAWLDSREDAGSYWTAVYFLFFAFALPIALVTRIQPSVVILVWIAWKVTRTALRDERSVAPAFP